MANLQTLVLNLNNLDGQKYPKYFSITDVAVPLIPDLDVSEVSFWYQKDIDAFRQIDAETVEFTCIVEDVDNNNTTKSIVLFFSDGTPFLLGVLLNEISKNNKVIVNIQFKISTLNTAGMTIHFDLIDIDKNQEGLLSLNNLVTLGNQITKNTTLLNKIYLENVLDTPEISSDIFTL